MWALQGPFFCSSYPSYDLIWSAVIFVVLFILWQTLAPIYEQLATVFAGEKSVVIAKVDATEDGDLASKYGVSGYPTIKFFPAGESEATDYSGGRDIKDLVEFINSQVGTSRNVDGTLVETAGRVAELDSIIEASKGSWDAAFASAIADAAGKLEGSSKDFGKLYVAAANKVVAKGVSYVSTESKRLENMAKSGSVNPEQRTNFQLRINILRAFA